MEHLEFVVKCYNKQELAQMYFPDLTIRASVNKLRRWMRRFDSRFCRRTPKQFGGSISVIFKRSVYISQSIGRYDERGFFCVCAACIGER